MKVCVCGYGVVGQGVVDILDRQNPLLVKSIFTKEAIDDIRYINNYDDVLQDTSITVVVEAIGGIEPAYSMLKSALEHKKHVVTSNKELVEKHLVDLLQTAKDHGVMFLFEASVGGGIPLISTLKNALSHEEIYEVQAILNGTTNYILSKMLQENKDYHTVLKEAQDLGYAEKNPKDDVEGFDAARKIAILASLIQKEKVDFKSVKLQGITHISPLMIEYAQKEHYRIRLIAKASFSKDGLRLSVMPTLVNQDHPLYSVDGVNNAVLIKGKDVGEVLLQGAGAGRYPTASAMVADVMSTQLPYHRNFEVHPTLAQLQDESFSVFDFKTMDVQKLKNVKHPYYLVKAVDL